MKEYIEREALMGKQWVCRTADIDGVTYADLRDIADYIAEFPVADVVEVNTLKSWLYEIAMNNVGVAVEDFAAACEEITNRLDGLRAFQRERRNDP